MSLFWGTWSSRIWQRPLWSAWQHCSPCFRTLLEWLALKRAFGWSFLLGNCAKIVGPTPGPASVADFWHANASSDVERTLLLPNVEAKDALLLSISFDCFNPCPNYKRGNADVDRKFKKYLGCLTVLNVQDAESSWQNLEQFHGCTWEHPLILQTISWSLREKSQLWRYWDWLNRLSTNNSRAELTCSWRVRCVAKTDQSWANKSSIDSMKLGAECRSLTRLTWWESGARWECPRWLSDSNKRLTSRPMGMRSVSSKTFPVARGTFGLTGPQTSTPPKIWGGPRVGQAVVVPGEDGVHIHARKYVWHIL